MRSISIWSILFFGLIVIQADDEYSPRPKYFILIMADDLGYGDLGCYGNQTATTPHIDRMADEGVRLTRYYSGGPVCSPTRAALMTGRYPQRAGIPGVINADPKTNRHHGLQLQEWTLAEMFKHSGWRTGITGKWHLGYSPKYNPIHQGFDWFRGYVSGNVDYHSHLDRMGHEDWWHDTELKPEKGYTTRLITRHAIDFIKANKGRAFFLYIPHEAPHDPFQGPDDPAFRVKGRVTHQNLSDEVKRLKYREMIRDLDKGVGEVLQCLRQLEMERESVVIFCSDNGATRMGSNGPLRGFKSQLWEGGIRVPAMVWAPGRVAPGRVSDFPVTSMDWFPTAAGWTAAGSGATPKSSLDGLDVTDVLTADGSRLNRDRKLFWSFGKTGAMMDGDFKLVIEDTRPDSESEVGLFNLRLDPGENQSLSESLPEKTKSMINAWRHWDLDARTHAVKQPES